MNENVDNNEDACPSYFVVSFETGMDVMSNAKKVKRKYGKNFGIAGSVLTLELNLKKQQLICHVNGVNHGVAVDNIAKDDNVKYKLAVSLFWDEIVIQIQTFECK